MQGLKLDLTYVTFKQIKGNLEIRMAEIYTETYSILANITF